MGVCLACKNKDSTERCSNKALRGLLFCGTHARMKGRQFWKPDDTVDAAIRIQKVWKGHCVRNWLRLAGPGVLKRSICHNEEELFTFDEKTRVYPLDYFAFEEAGKVYWFDIRTLLQHSIDKIEPTNPYTREPLNLGTRIRLHKLAVKRDMRKMSNLHNHDEPKNTEKLLDISFTSLCQILRENGVKDIYPIDFSSLNRPQLHVFIRMMKRGIIDWVAQKPSLTSRRRELVVYIDFLRAEEENREYPLPYMLFMTSQGLVKMLNKWINKPKPLCDIIMNALNMVV